MYWVLLDDEENIPFGRVSGSGVIGMRDTTGGFKACISARTTEDRI